jgi:signal transduction histidine kinase
MWTLTKRSKEMALEHAELESLVLQREEELQILSQRLLKVQDEERRRLARDLHDSTGQTLAALKINVSFLEARSQADSSERAIVAEVRALADQAIREIRTMSYLLHPPLLDEVGFACAAEWFVDGFAKRSGIDVVADFPTGDRLPKNMELALFRVLQECLTNVHRHSGATAVTVVFQQKPDMVILKIQDYGRGISSERLALLRETGAESGVGLAGMRERMNELTGRLEIESGSGGTTVQATVPLYPIVQSALFAGYAQVGAVDAA